MNVRRYEDLATDPQTAFRELYTVCGLTWTERARKRIAWATTDHGKPRGGSVAGPAGGLSRTGFRPMDSRSSLGSFRQRLSQQEIDQVHEITDTVAARYYDAKDGVTPVWPAEEDVPRHRPAAAERMERTG